MSPRDTDEHHKTVYAHFGVAIYLAQCLEHGLVNALVYLDLIPNTARAIRDQDEWAAAVDAFMDRSFENTLGRLISSLRKVAKVEGDLEMRLSEALKTRNWLAHDYFRERAVYFMSEAGRDKMIIELEAAQNLFLDADKRLDVAFRPVREKYGFTDEALEQAYEHLYSKALGK